MNSKFDALERCVILSSDGRMMRLNTTLIDMGPRDDLLLAASGEAAGVPLYHMCDMPGTTPPMKVHVYAASNIGMAVRLNSLRFNTAWELEDDSGVSVMVPTFGNAGAGINLALDWIPPADCALYLVVRSGTPYLIALHRKVDGDKHWRAIRLDVPNVYADGRICMGRNWAPPESGAYVERLRAYLDSLHSSTWNTDLLDGRQTVSKQLIRFNAGTGECLPPKVEWWKCGAVVSGSSFNWLTTMAQSRRAAP